MHTKAVSAVSVVLLLLTMCPTLFAADEDRVLFDFGKPDAAKAWQTVNDGVMGGVSDGRFKITDNKTLEFYGTLSLENNGGFASVRSREAKLGLEEGDLIVIRVRGDGRDYTFRLNVPRSISRNSYRQSFKTKKDEWIEVTLPMEKFVATWRGRVYPNEKFDPSNVTGMGIQLSDKKPGPFKLEVEWIKVKPASDARISFDSYSGYFVSNKFEPKAKQSFVVIKDQKEFDKVFGVAFVMNDKSHRLPKDAFESLIVLAIIKRGNAFWEYEMENATVEQGVVQLRYATKSKATPDTTFACPLIISVPKGDYKTVTFIENGKEVKTVKVVHTANRGAKPQ